MESSKIYIKPLGKSFYVRHTNKLMKMSIKFQLLMAQLGTISSHDDPENQMNMELKYSNALVDFPKQVLKLSDKQAETLDNCEQSELQKIAVEIALTIRGLSKRDIDKTLDDMDKSMNNGEDPRKSEKQVTKH